MSAASLSFRSNVLDAAAAVPKNKDTLVIISPLNNGPIDVMRDVRDHERQRQHTKKSAGHVKAKERKERGAAQWAMWGEKAKSPTARAARGSWFGGKDNRAAWDDEHDIDEKEVEVDHVISSPRVTVPDSVRSYVQLADLVTTKKSRKLVEGDFEVIPAPRSVIVLDDFASQDMDVDEHWEFIYNEDEKARGPSYAQVVSSAK
jgi:hypothetical protein